MPQKLTDVEIEAAAVEAMRTALGRPESDIGYARLRNLQYYDAQPIGDLALTEIEDRSDFVATDVADTVDGMLPQLLRMFIESTDAVEFEPLVNPSSNPQQEAYANGEAKLATAYINHLFYVRNDGASIAHDWFKDALLQKNGFVKVWAEEDADEAKQRYDAITQDQLAMLQQDGWKVVGEPQLSDQSSAAGMPLLSVVVSKESRSTAIKVRPIAPASMRIDANARWNDEPAMIADECYRRRFELEQEGYDLDDFGNANESGPTDMEHWQMLGEGRAASTDVAHPSHALYRCAEVYIKLDADGDGIAEWLKIYLIEDRLATFHGKPAWEEVDGHPYEWITPLPRPHAFFGDCPADRVIEVQKLRTRTVRAIQDNMFLSVNQRTYLNVNAGVNLDDFLDSRPGGAVRGTAPPNEAFAPMVQPSLGAEAYQFNEYIASWAENRSGFNRYSAGTDQNALNKTAHGVEMLTSKADMRMDLIARFFAVGMRNMFSKMLKLAIQHQNVPEMVKVNGSFFPINPSEFKNQYVCRINVGLGNGSKDAQAQRVMGLLQIQERALPLGIVSPAQIAEAIKLYLQATDFKNPERFVSSQPSGMPPPQVYQQQKQQALQTIQRLQQQLQQAGQQNQLLQIKLANRQAEIDTKRQDTILRHMPNDSDTAAMAELEIQAYNAETARLAQQALERFQGVQNAQEDARVVLDAQSQFFDALQAQHEAAAQGSEQAQQIAPQMPAPVQMSNPYAPQPPTFTAPSPQSMPPPQPNPDTPL